MSDDKCTCSNCSCKKDKVDESSTISDIANGTIEVLANVADAIVQIEITESICDVVGAVVTGIAESL